MDPLSEARALLPSWVVWGGALAYLVVAALTSLVASWLGVRLALGLRGPTADAHWTEHARQAFPARIASGMCVVLLPVLFGVMARLWIGPLCPLSPSQLGGAAAAVAFVPALATHRRLARRVLPDPPRLGYWLMGALVMWGAVRPLLPIALLLALLAPDELLSAAMGLWLLAALLLLWLALKGYGLRLLQWTGGVWPASAEVTALVKRAADRRGGGSPSALPHVLVLRWSMVNAFAYPSANILGFTDAALAKLDDDELEAVAAHELGHLSEPARARAVRSLQALMWIPLAAAKPLYSAFGLKSLFGLLVMFLLALVPLRRFSRRMETRADHHAHDDGQDAGIYARALEKLYRLNAIPAVLRQAQSTHPHLYDRLVAAGVEPAYPRPAPPSRWRSLGGLTVAVVLALAPTAAAWMAPFWLEPSGGDEEQVALAYLALGQGGSWELGTLADLRLERGDADEAIVLYRAAASVAYAPGLELARLTMALAQEGRCGEAHDAFEQLKGHQQTMEPDDLAGAAASIASCQGSR